MGAVCQLFGIHVSNPEFDIWSTVRVLDKMRDIRFDQSQRKDSYKSICRGDGVAPAGDPKRHLHLRPISFMRYLTKSGAMQSSFVTTKDKDKVAG